MKGITERSLAAVFKASRVPHAHAHRFRHTLAAELLGNGASFEEVADVLGSSPENRSQALRQMVSCPAVAMDDLMMQRVHSGTDWTMDAPPHIN